LALIVTVLVSLVVAVRVIEPVVLGVASSFANTTSLKPLTTILGEIAVVSP
jgi:hypothetical protein